jgi:hypothetical protein
VTADAGTLAARERVAYVLGRLERVELGVIVVSLPDAVRLDARDRAREAAVSAGRSGLLDEATETARATAMRSFARAGFSGTWAATEMSASVASASDRVAAASAFEEAVTAAVVDDLVDEDTLAILRYAIDELARSNELPAPGSLTALTAGAGHGAASGRSGVLLPTAVGVAVVAGVLVTGSVVGALAGGFVVAGIGWLAGRRSRPAD